MYKLIKKQVTLSTGKRITIISIASLLVLSLFVLPLTLTSTQQPQTTKQHAAITSPCATSPSGQAMPLGDIAGWHQIMADDFSGSSLSSNWGGPYSAQPGGDPAGWWDPAHVIVGNCLLTLTGYKDVAAKSGLFVTGGVGGSIAQTYGKYLVRMRADKGDGISAIALLWPQDNSWPPEIDFFEDGGGNRKDTSATLHCGINNNDSCRVQKTLSGVDFSQWHTVGVEWTKGKLVYTLDGKAWATVTDSRVPSIPMVLDLQTQSLVCSQYNTCLSSATPARVDMQVDWVVAYAPSNINPTATPAPSLQPSVTSDAGNVQLSLALKLHGIGSGGDSKNIASSGNTNPLHPQRTVTVTLTNAANTVLSPISGTVTYVPATGDFRGFIDVGTLPAGSYLVKIASSSYLTTSIPNIITLTPGQTTSVSAALVAGDVNNDNKIDVLDYNIQFDCYSDFSPARNCTPTKKAQADITDDGIVNSNDINLLLRELSIRAGQ